MAKRIRQMIHFCQFFVKNGQFWQIFFKNHRSKCPLTDTFIRQLSVSEYPSTDFLTDIVFWSVFCYSTTDFLRDFAVLVRFLLSVDGPSHGDYYFSLFFVVPWRTERRAMQIELASVRHMIRQTTETCSISVVLRPLMDIRRILWQIWNPLTDKITGRKRQITDIRSVNFLDGWVAKRQNP